MKYCTLLDRYLQLLVDHEIPAASLPHSDAYKMLKKHEDLFLEGFRYFVAHHPAVDTNREAFRNRIMDTFSKVHNVKHFSDILATANHFYSGASFETNENGQRLWIEFMRMADEDKKVVQVILSGLRKYVQTERDVA